MRIKWYECPVCKTKFNYYKELMGEETQERIANICMFKMNTFLKHKKINDDKLYKSIPNEKKQVFLDSMHRGNTVGQSYVEAGLTKLSTEILLTNYQASLLDKWKLEHDMELIVMAGNNIPERIQLLYDNNNGVLEAIIKELEKREEEVGK